MDMTVIREMKVSRRRARRYRRPIKSSYLIKLNSVLVLGYRARYEHESRSRTTCLTLGSEHWEEDNIANRSGAGKKHDHPIDANPLSRCRRHAVLQSAQEIFVRGTGQLIARSTRFTTFARSTFSNNFPFACL